MNVAVAFGTMVLGGWVLNEPVDEVKPLMPAVTLESSESAEPSRQESPEMTPRGPVLMNRGQVAPADAARSSAGRSAGGAGQPVQRQRMAVMPLSPTESGDGGMGQPTSPTSSSTGLPDMVIPPSTGRSEPLAPTTYHRGGTSRSGSRPTSYSSIGGVPSVGSQSTMPLLGAANLSPQTTEKAFSNYQPPPTISPYMNLFRRGDDLGTIDNYSTLVRPELQQRYMNQRLGNDIRNVELNTRLQGMRLQQMKRQETQLQGIATPQFMNSGNYYPGR